MDPNNHITERYSSEDAGKYFRYMADFVGFIQADADAIRKSALIIEKHLPNIIGNFYTNLLQYPPTRKFFLKSDGTVDEAYLQLRMYHQANFWRRTAGGVYDDEYARFVDYVGRAHTSRGADPHIYIAERYVIGMVGFIQHAIIEALMSELHEYDPELETQAIKAWNKLCMVILEMLARAYGHEREAESFSELLPVDSQEIMGLSVDSYEKGLGMNRRPEPKDVVVAQLADIPDGERKIVQVDGLSIGVFHHKGSWYALRNSCLHRGGPVATGNLVDDKIICPWHGFTYDVTNGQLLTDPSARLEMYPVTVRDGEVYLRIPVFYTPPVATEPLEEIVVKGSTMPAETKVPAENEFLLKDVLPGKIKLVHLNGQRVAVYNVDGAYYATEEECTHSGGPLSEGELEGNVVTCPWHYSCFDVTTGRVECRPATVPLRTFRVIVEGETGKVEV
jgi:nitrite reductase/ring-hydroxylating ferredoxin subunit